MQNNNNTCGIGRARHPANAAQELPKIGWCRRKPGNAPARAAIPLLKDASSYESTCSYEMARERCKCSARHSTIAVLRTVRAQGPAVILFKCGNRLRFPFHQLQNANGFL